MKKTITICDLCIDIGLEVLATHRYMAEDGEDYDLCPDCHETVKEMGLNTWKI